ncbi:hypothetical protein TYRP_006279 [Tyrophagus putrescentiae]|nr:hypothetical protein TYRP_006279 [Tyrophagus putrescentiae]
MPIGTSSTRWRGKELRRGVDQYLHKVHQMGTRLLKDEHVAELKLQQRRPPADGQLAAGRRCRKVRISASAPVSVYSRERRAISSIQSAGKRGGSRFMKKSFRAVATAFTGMSSSEGVHVCPIAGHPVDALHVEALRLDEAVVLFERLRFRAPAVPELLASFEAFRLRRSSSFWRFFSAFSAFRLAFLLLLLELLAVLFSSSAKAPIDLLFKFLTTAATASKGVLEGGNAAADQRGDRVRQKGRMTAAARVVLVSKKQSFTAIRLQRKELRELASPTGGRGRSTTSSSSSTGSHFTSVSLQQLPLLQIKRFNCSR